ncbi:transposase, IS30 family protein, partial [Neisseria meningitidis NM3147]
RDLVVFAQVGAYLFGTEFAADKGVDVLNQLRIELIGLSLTLFDSRLCRWAFSALYCCPWVRCRLISRLMVL